MVRLVVVRLEVVERLVVEGFEVVVERLVVAGLEVVERSVVAGVGVAEGLVVAGFGVVVRRGFMRRVRGLRAFGFRRLIVGLMIKLGRLFGNLLPDFCFCCLYIFGILPFTCPSDRKDDVI